MTTATLTDTCSEDFCKKPIRSKGLCNSHYLRQWRKGTTAASPRGTGERNNRWRGKGIDYRGAHRRVEGYFGKASNHQCVCCDSPADEWSYVGGCPDEKVEVIKNSMMRFSPNPCYYEPMDKTCHTRFDRGWREWEANFGKL